MASAPTAGINKGGPSDFLTVFLKNPGTSIPKGAQWAVLFNDLAGTILPAIGEAYAREPGNNEWKTRSAAAFLLSEPYQNPKGCMFCQAIGLPGEGLSPIVEGSIKTNGFIRSHVGQGRNDFQEMRMSFLETNLSFCDSFLRGWSMATAHFGMFAEYGNKNYRTDLTCFKFGVTPKGPIILQQVNFKGVCCTSVTEEEYNYDTPNTFVKREARFVYHSYSVDVDSHSSSLIPEVKPVYNYDSVTGNNIGAGTA